MCENIAFSKNLKLWKHGKRLNSLFHYYHYFKIKIQLSFYTFSNFNFSLRKDEENSGLTFKVNLKNNLQPFEILIKHNIKCKCLRWLFKSNSSFKKRVNYSEYIIYEA